MVDHIILFYQANTSTDDAAAETAPNEAGDGSGNEEPKEVEPKVMTLDEWKKQQVCSKAS
jgi:hypothetical protein